MSRGVRGWIATWGGRFVGEFGGVQGKVKERRRSIPEKKKKSKEAMGTLERGRIASTQRKGGKVSGKSET